METPEEVAAIIAEAMKYVAKEKIFPCTNCGMAPMRRDIAAAKLVSLGKGAALARQKFGKPAKYSRETRPEKIQAGEEVDQKETPPLMRRGILCREIQLSAADSEIRPADAGHPAAPPWPGFGLPCCCWPP